MCKNRIASHLVETIIAVAPDEYIVRIFQLLTTASASAASSSSSSSSDDSPPTNLATLAVDPAANFPIQRLLARLPASVSSSSSSTPLISLAFSLLSPSLPLLVSSHRLGILTSLLTAFTTRLRTAPQHRSRIIKQVCAAFGVTSKKQRERVVITTILGVPDVTGHTEKEGGDNKEGDSSSSSNFASTARQFFNIQGSLILQQLLLFVALPKLANGGDCAEDDDNEEAGDGGGDDSASSSSSAARFLIASFLHLSPAYYHRLATCTAGSRLIDCLLTRLPLSVLTHRHKQQVVDKFRGRFVALAMGQHTKGEGNSSHNEGGGGTIAACSSFVIQRLFDVADAAHRSMIADELSHVDSTRLKSTVGGRFLYIHCNLALYAKNKHEWRQQWKQKTAREAMFKEILQDDEGNSSSNNYNLNVHRNYNSNSSSNNDYDGSSSRSRHTASEIIQTQSPKQSDKDEAKKRKHSNEETDEMDELFEGVVDSKNNTTDDDSAVAAAAVGIRNVQMDENLKSVLDMLSSAGTKPKKRR